MRAAALALLAVLGLAGEADADRIFYSLSDFLAQGLQALCPAP